MSYDVLHRPKHGNSSGLVVSQASCHGLALGALAAGAWAHLGTMLIGAQHLHLASLSMNVKQPHIVVNLVIIVIRAKTKSSHAVPVT